MNQSKKRSEATVQIIQIKATLPKYRQRLGLDISVADEIVLISK